MAENTRSMALVATMLLLGACTVAPPTGPTVAVFPPQGKDLSQFQHEDLSCRDYASNLIGGLSPSDAANQSLAGSAALGTLLGGAAGAAIGAATGNPAAGAAIGGGSGLLLGAASGTNAAAYSSGTLQQQYNIGYLQCMSAVGNVTPSTAYGYPNGYGYPYRYPFARYPYAYAYPYPYPYGYPW